MEKNTLSVATVHRMPTYLRLLQEEQKSGREYISSVSIAQRLELNPVLVKKDLSFAITVYGKPKIGYYIPDLIADIERFMGYDNMSDAVLVGAGKLGSALLGYPRIEQYGLKIIAAFDVDEEIIGKKINGIKVYPLSKLANMADRLSVKIGIITVPENSAQSVAELMVASGIRAVWNFAPKRLNLPDNVAVKNEDFASSLAILINSLKEVLKK